MNGYHELKLKKTKRGSHVPLQIKTMNCELWTVNQSCQRQDFRAPTLDSYFPRNLRQPTPTRLPCGTLKDSLTVATFRSWRVRRAWVAQDLIFNIAHLISHQKIKEPQVGIQPRYSGFRVTGHR